MHTEVYVRHSEKCPHKANRFYRKCKCRKWIAVAGQDKRISAETRSWEQAERKAREISTSDTDAKPGNASVHKAVKLFLEDKEQQALSPQWIGKLKREMGELEAWANNHGHLLLSELSLERLEEFRKEWNGVPITRRKRQERLRSFFLYCRKHQWVPDNVAEGLSTIKVKASPTLPLNQEQFDSIIEAAQVYNPKAPDAEWRRQRAIAMLLLLRWSGLRIGDASRLERASLTKAGKLLLYMSKTGEGVYVPLPPATVKALVALKNPLNPKYFFWNGTSAKESTGKRWWSTLKKIFTAAGVEAHPHMLRDTFAVECLLAGIPIDQVAILLGHSSIKVTEKHYAPWVRARQDQLDESVKKSWKAN